MRGLPFISDDPFFSTKSKPKQRSRRHPVGFNFLTAATPPHPRLVGHHLALALLVATQLEVLAALEGALVLDLAHGALQTQHNLLRGLGLWSEKEKS